MRDISLHLLDLIQNCLRAGAGLISCQLQLNEAGRLQLTLTDDGCGMDEVLLQQVLSPFGTTRTSRKVGLGLPLAMANARLTGGDLHLRSRPGEGTTLELSFFTRHVDCLPLGDIAQSLWTAIVTHPFSPDFVLSLSSPKGSETFDTRELRQALGPEIGLDEPEVSQYILQALQAQCQTVFEGVL